MRSRPNRRALAAGAILALVAALALPAPLLGAAVGDAHGSPAVTADVPRAEAPEHPASGHLHGVGHLGGPIPPTAIRPRGSTIGASGALAGPGHERFGAPEPDRGGSGDGSEASERRVTLVTGETVVVRERAGERSFEVVSGGPVHVVTANDRTLLLPEGVDLRTYDRSLFDVDALLSARSDGGGVPVLLAADASPAEIDSTGLRNVRHLRSAGVVAAELDPAAAGRTVPGLVDDGLVRGVSLDHEVARPPVAASSAGAPVRSFDLTGEGVTVAVLDTGIDATHPALADNVVGQVDLVDGDEDESREGDDDADEGGDGVPNGSTTDGIESDRGVEANATDVAPDANGHGTHVAGVLAGADTGDGGGHAGVAPGAALLDVRVMDDRGAGQASTIIRGIEYAVERDVDVILLSIGSSIDGGDAIAESVEWATERGVVVIAAAGNEGNPRTIGAPGRPEGAITVGATNGNGEVASYSSRGPTLDGGLKPDLVAPGDRVVGPRSANSDRGSVDDAGRYTRMSGTSAAAPQVAGAAALLLEAEPDLTAREVEARLGSGARPVPGGHAYTHGSGEVDVERALDPDVVVDDPAIDFGLLEDDRTANRTVTVTNHDDRPHELTFDVRVRNVDLDVDADGTASLNRTELSLAPGERANLTLAVSGDTPSGAYAGEIRYSVAGEPRTAAFGFVRGGTVTVEKRPFTAGSRVDGEELWVLAEEGTHDELLEFRNGTARFVAGGGSYLLWSWGTDEETDTVSFLSERRSFDGPTHVVLDERDTVPFGVDAGPIEAEYGPLWNRLMTVSASAAYGDEVARLSITKQDVDGRVVRLSRDRELDVAATYLLTTEPAGSAAFDVSDVFQLGHGVEGVLGPSVSEVSPDRLVTSEHRLHRNTVDETYSVQDRMVVDGVWNQVTRRWFDLGGRTAQRVHRSPDASYHRAFRGAEWSAHRESRGEVVTTADVLSHPMHGLLETVRVEDGVATVAGTPFSDGAGTRFDPPGDHRIAVSVDGEVVREERVRQGRSAFDDVPIEPGQDLAVRIVGENPDGYLSTRTVTEVTVPDYRPDDRAAVDGNRPPIVTDVSVRGADAANAIQPGEVTAVFEVDSVGPAINPVVWYATNDAAEPPWENRSAWRRAETKRVDDRILATVDVGESAETLSLAASVGDIRGHRTRTMTLDAVHVGSAPNTSTSVLAGRLLAADGTAADNDTVVVDPAGEGRPRYVRTDGAGRFAVEVRRDRSYDLTYLRGEPWVASEPTADGRPAWLPLERVHVDEDVDLGTRALPEAGAVTVHVNDERGEPVPGASVRVSQRVGNVSAAERLETGEDGLARRSGNDEAGIELAGTLELTVEPPDDDLYPEQEHRLDVAVDGPRHVNVTVETAPPTATLAAFGAFEPGGVVFLHARKSEVPAGVDEYRWDLDGDGVADRITEEPTVRYVPDERTLRPTLRVVDEAGKTDESTLTIRLREEDAGS